ncbi:MAG TPA: amidase, partial [Hadesarchaea archaeon]|nr:amidase [Hadesarchaea archaeon]
MDQETLEKLEKIQLGEFSAAENVRSALERVEKLNERINAFIEISPNAETEAEAVDRRI